MKSKISLIILLFSIAVFSQSANETEFKKLIENSFQKIWSDLKTDEVKNFYTDDFLLFEDGEIWNNDSVKIAIQDIKSRFESEENKAHKFERINKFDFLKSYSEGNFGWIAYHNYADIQMSGNSIAKIHWLETATFIKTKDGWRIHSLHSTTFKEKDKN